ncbi:hypothetical protein V2O64_25105 (plasmid) [Verrucomicrobiaceae bacterium 227]
MKETRRSFIKKSSFTAASSAFLGHGTGLAAEGEASSKKCNDCPPEFLPGSGVTAEIGTRVITKWETTASPRTTKWIYGNPTNTGLDKGPDGTADPDTRLTPEGGFPDGEFIDPCEYSKHEVPKKTVGGATPWAPTPADQAALSAGPRAATYKKSGVMGDGWIELHTDAVEIKVRRTVSWTDKQEYRGVCQIPGH